MSDEETPEQNRGNAGKGRPKGSLNKVTLAAREAILLAAEGLGGVDGLIAWVKKDDVYQRLFWTVIYPKVLPYGGGPDTNVAAAVTGALVWRMPEPDEASAETAIAVAAAEAEAVIAVSDAAAAEVEVAAADGATGAAEAAAAGVAEEEEEEAEPAPVAATVVWKAPGSAGAKGQPELPGGPPVAGAVAGAAAPTADGGAPARPPPET
jgi:hypothetical protein